MQPITGAPRDALTAAKVVALLRDAPATGMGFGCEIIDRALNVVRDITPAMRAGAVSRASYADLHGSAALAIAEELDWGAVLLRPYVTVRSPVTLARFNMGAYWTSTPKTSYGRSPLVHEVDGIDVLDALRSPVGESYSVSVGTGYLAAVESVLVALGFPAGAYVIDQSRASAVLPSARTWVLDEGTTWLGIINDLLGSIGYMGVWSDWDGRLRVQQYTSPSARTAEWTYDTLPATSMLSPIRTVERDRYSAPNRWVFYRSNNVEGAAPVEGNGVWTYINQTNGPTSVEGRNGRVFTKVVGLDVADQDALVNAGQSAIDADMRTTTKVELSTWPNPLHWHFDVVHLDDPEIGPVSKALVTKWTLPFDGKPMSQEWSIL